jgi:hypothetical protein
MRIGGIIDQALDGLFGWFLPEEVVEKVVDPITDVLGGTVDAAMQRYDGAAKGFLGLAEDVAQWAGEGDLARKIDDAAQAVGVLLEPPLACASKDGTALARHLGKELGARAAGAGAGAVAGGLARGDVGAAASYAKVGAGALALDMSQAGQADAAAKRACRVAGAAAGAAAGAGLAGEAGLRAGIDQGGDLGGRIEAATRADVASLRRAVAVARAVAHAGGIAAGVCLANEWSVARPGRGPQPNLAASQWTAGAGAAAGDIAEGVRSPAAGEMRGKTRDQVLAALRDAARAGSVVTQGVAVQARSEGADVAGTDAAAKVLGYASTSFRYAPAALDWLASTKSKEDATAAVLSNERDFIEIDRRPALGGERA